MTITKILHSTLYRRLKYSDTNIPNVQTLVRISQNIVGGHGISDHALLKMRIFVFLFSHELDVCFPT